MSKTHTLVDNFNDNTIDAGVWTVTGPVTETGGRLECAPPSNGYAFLQSQRRYDLTDSSVTIEVLQLSAASTWLAVQADSSNYLRMGARSNGSFSLGHAVQAVWTYDAEPGYDPAAHRWWRFRERSGWTYGEVSPDGVDWTTLFAIPTPFPVSAVRLYLGAGESPSAPVPGVAIFDNLNTPAGVPVAVAGRDCEAFRIRVRAATLARDRARVVHANNGEELDYPYVASFSKGLQHDSAGDVLPASYESLLLAVETGDEDDFEAILLGAGGKKLTNPQGGLAFTLQGPDPAAVTQPPAPRIDAAQNSAEMGELYWMALARDVHFGEYGTDAVVQDAIQSLNTDFSDFRGPRESGAVTAQTVFRGIYPGETVGPYLSQFLLKGTSDPRLPAGEGHDTTDGLITYGALKIDQRQVTVDLGIDYLTAFGDWLDVQNGEDRRGQDAIDTGARRFIRNLRDLGERVHIDNVGDLFFNACLVLLHAVPGNQLAGSGVITRDMEFPWSPGSPYPAYARQAPFVTLSAPHALSLVWEALIRSLRAVWFQKWFVHRRLRPEEFGGRIDNHLSGRRSYPQIDGEILDALTTGGLAPYFGGQSGDTFPSYLLPQAFPEGAPTHPAYGAGHATGAGACATVLKALFAESTPIENPVVASADGLALEAYTGAGASLMTVGGELNKLAGNIAIGRNAAGVHWRSDYDQSLLLGERVAIQLLQEQSLLLNEPEFYPLTRFNGTTIRIHDGVVSVV